MTAAPPQRNPFTERMLAAMQLHVKGQIEDAAGAYQSLLAQYPEQPDILDSLGIISMQQSQWAPLFALAHIQFISLQYGNHTAEIDRMDKLFPGKLITDPQVDAFADPDALAAQIAAMDAVVSIQNATVHFAGALGVATTLLLSAASDWRWGLENTHSHWYKSVYIERQETLSEWNTVIGRVRNRLENNT